MVVSGARTLGISRTSSIKNVVGPGTWTMLCAGGNLWDSYALSGRYHHHVLSHELHAADRVRTIANTDSGASGIQ